MCLLYYCFDIEFCAQIGDELGHEIDLVGLLLVHEAILTFEYHALLIRCTGLIVG